VTTSSLDGDEMLLHVVEPGDSVGEVGVCSTVSPLRERGARRGQHRGRRPSRSAVECIDCHPRASERVTLGLNQTELGQRVGGTRPSVNSALRAFVRPGWITVDDAQIVIEDPPAPRRFLKS